MDPNMFVALMNTIAMIGLKGRGERTREEALAYGQFLDYAGSVTRYNRLLVDDEINRKLDSEEVPDAPDVRTLRRESRDRANLARAVYRLVASEAFGEAFADANGEADAVTALVRSFDKEGLEHWLRRRRDAEVGALTLRELRALGQKLGVSRYNRLPKASLLSEIVDAQK